MSSETSANPSPAVPPASPDAPRHTQSLYRKYRPQSFHSDELVGQEHVVHTLRNAVLLDRVAHAYLFCGPRGTGKTTTARLLAKAVNCLDPDPTHRPCNHCENCRAIASGAATDVIEIDAASNRGIDDIRDLRERVKYAPTQLKTKFYIIDEAHQITGPAANAFLKTLEEPPGHTKFVLATTDPEELLPTIVSRCQRFDFRRIALEPMIGRLRTVATAEGLTVEDEALTVIARHATGSLRDALGLLDQLAVYRDETAADQQGITADLARALLGVSRNERIETLVQAIADRDPGLALGTVNAAIESGEDPRQLNRQLVAYLRVLLHQRAGGSPDADARAAELANRFELLELATLARQFNEIDYRIRHSSFSQLPLETALVEAVLRGQTETASVPAVAPASPSRPSTHAVREEPALPERPPTTALRDRLRDRDTPVSRVAPPPATPPSPRPVPPPVAAEPQSTPATSAPPAPIEGTLSVDQLMNLWPRIRQDVKAVNRRIEALLTETDPAAMHGDQLILATAYEFHRNRLNMDDVRAVLEDVITRLCGRRVVVSAVLRGDPLAMPAPAATPAVSPPPPAPVEPPPTVEPPVPSSSSNGSTPSDADEQRLRAVKNIFDAEVIES